MNTTIKYIVAALAGAMAITAAPVLAQDNNVDNAEGTDGSKVLVLAGADRYETAAQIALHRSSDTSEVLYIANGESLVDAMVVGTSSGRMATLLVRRDEIPAATITALCAVDHAKLVFLGGDAVISPQVRDQVATFTRNYVTRTGGQACAGR